MKAKIEVAANVIVILVAIVVGAVFLKDRFAAPAPGQVAVKAGDRLPSLAGWNWASHDQTLVMVLRKGCHFCEDSVPFYQRLVTQQQEASSNVPILAVFPDGVDTVKEVVQSERLSVPALAEVPLEQLKASGTPTLLLVDKNGTVVNAWAGMLSPRQELEVMSAMKGAVASTAKSPG